MNSSSISVLIKKIPIAFVKFIVFTDTARNALNKSKELNNLLVNVTKISGLLSIFSTFACITLLFAGNSLVEPLAIILSLSILTYSLTQIIGKSKRMFTKLSHFMFYGTCCSLGIFGIFSMLNYKLLTPDMIASFTRDFQLVNSMIIPTLAATFFWSICSCFATTKIAIAGNAILTGIVTLLREIALVAFAFYNHIPNISTQIEETISPVELELYLLIYQEKMTSAVDTAINTFALPPIIILGFATIVCVLKDYVEKEYIAPAAYID